jgi:hypothetical protein
MAKVIRSTDMVCSPCVTLWNGPIAVWRQFGTESHSMSGTFVTDERRGGYYRGATVPVEPVVGFWL